MKICINQTKYGYIYFLMATVRLIYNRKCM